MEYVVVELKIVDHTYFVINDLLSKLNFSHKMISITIVPSRKGGRHNYKNHLRLRYCIGIMNIT